jgi:transcriptional regulator with XRE-family HTH domain
MNFAKRLATLRKEAGLTQKELADKLGVSRGTIGMYEIGQRDPDTETLQKLSDIFGVSVDYLLGKTDIRNPSDEITSF